MSAGETRETGMEIREGDVYRFAYSPETWQRARTGIGHADLHWCFDGQLVYRNGLLYDTYWGLTWGVVDGRHFTAEQAHAEGELTYVCNLNDVEKIREDEYQLYAEGDAFNLSHQHGCYKHYVRRKGAKKNPELMRQALEARVQKARKDIEAATRDLESAVRWRELMLPRIEAGEEPNL